MKKGTIRVYRIDEKHFLPPEIERAQLYEACEKFRRLVRNSLRQRGYILPGNEQPTKPTDQSLMAFIKSFPLTAPQAYTITRFLRGRQYITPKSSLYTILCKRLGINPQAAGFNLYRGDSQGEEPTWKLRCPRLASNYVSGSSSFASDKEKAQYRNSCLKFRELVYAALKKYNIPRPEAGKRYNSSAMPSQFKKLLVQVYGDRCSAQIKYSFIGFLQGKNLISPASSIYLPICYTLQIPPKSAGFKWCNWAQKRAINKFILKRSR